MKIITLYLLVVSSLAVSTSGKTGNLIHAPMTLSGFKSNLNLFNSLSQHVSVGVVVHALAIGRKDDAKEL